ncbi:hypothetical protein VP199E371_P0082 [Vibrio phage 199E37-1]|nr:hypothetical protein VP199E371_P0082 [Vibrio phage 199E37-1]
MGYEIKLIIGEVGTSGDKYKRSDVGEVDGNSVYYPYLKDSLGNLIKTKVKETYFMVAAQVDLCKPGYNSSILNALRKNEDPNHEYYYYGYDGNTRVTEDCYGDKSDIHSIDEIINALRKDVEDSDYRRFKWALSLLESIKENGGSELKVMWYGY